MARWHVTRFAALSLMCAVVAMLPGVMSAQADGFRVTVDLNEYDDSGISGTAILTTVQDGGVEVSMELRGAELDGDHPTHIHTGTCDDFDPDPLYPLETVELSSVNREGISETVLTEVALEELWEDEYVILVHQSAEQLTQYLVCGEIASGEREELSGTQGSEDAETEDAESDATGHGEDADDHESDMGVREGDDLPASGAGTALVPDRSTRALLPAALAILGVLALLSAAAVRLRQR